MGPSWTMAHSTICGLQRISLYDTIQRSWQAVVLGTNDVLTLTEPVSGESVQYAEQIAIK